MASESQARKQLMDKARKVFGSIEADPQLAETSGVRIKEILKARYEAECGGKEEARLRKVLSECVGVSDSGNGGRSTRVSRDMKKKLAERYKRS